MKMKKILSCALCAVMLFTSISALLPIRAEAAYVENSTDAIPVTKEISKIVEEAKSYNFSTAQQMYDYETAEGYLDKVHSKDGRYTIAVNRYTGISYYVNNITGQILTSNPYNAASAPASYNDILSQISISFKYVTDSSQTPTYNSYMWAAERSQISVQPIKNGLRVNYTLGDTVARYLLPGMITHDSMVENILMPMHDEFVALMEEFCREEYPDVNFTFFDNEDYEAYVDGCVNINKLRRYVSDYSKYYSFLNASGATEEQKSAYQRITKLNVAVESLFGGQYYFLQNPHESIYEQRPDLLEDLYNDYPITQAEDGGPGIPIFVLNASLENAVKATLSQHITAFCTYTYTMMYADEKECDYVDNTQQKPVFRCALEYTFNSDGTLSVSLPASSITFDESAFTLTSITPLKFFGAGDISTDGYLFYPDGSGSILKFDEYYNEALGIKRNINYSAEIYGKDYCYSNMGFDPTGAANHPAAQISMPVFGLVTEARATAATAAKFGFSEGELLNEGYFAVLEEGASMANLDFQAVSAAYKYINVYATYTPFPQDTFLLSNTISVGSNLGINVMVSDAKYTGSFKMRYVMLTDEAIGGSLPQGETYVPADYVGMATYYREYLKSRGVLNQMETVSENIPLYIETLGAMQIQSKFLTFPITETIALTTFEDVSTMYDSFREAGITNINFRLSGFANGGMHSTYPVKLKWEKVCGGKNGFENLIEYAKAESAKKGINFGVYPDFDFMYITNTKTFDGISNKGNVSRMIDNRYASKQEYNSVSQSYVSNFAMVISSAALSSLYTKFNGKYSAYGTDGISVSTMGEDLNSNLDVDDSTVRESSISYIQSVLSRMSSEYSVMMDMGNLYTLKYATHILNASIDSGHSRYCSFAIPFVGMILHSYVNYAGTALNYSGSPDYEILRSIESGAAPYYILCYGDTKHMKDDNLLNSYYSVDYENWFEEVVANYNKLNAELSGLQGYEIVDHRTLITERVTDAAEQAENVARLKAELLELLDSQLALAIQDAFATLRLEGKTDWGFALTVDTDALMEQFEGFINVDKESFGEQFATDMAAVIAEYEATYECSGTDVYTLTFDSIVYESRYSYVTDSYATDKDYHKTDYTNDLGQVVLVEYADGTRFILNYNIYAVRVNLGGTFYTLESYGYERIPREGGN